ncbi:MAG: helix-turn-helix domain-containing protein, partial [Kiloniellales bacterium]
MDRRETVEVFRERLGEVIARSGLTRSAFASQIGLDRSTLSQLLASENVRLPRADTIAAIAA